MRLVADCRPLRLSALSMYRSKCLLTSAKRSLHASARVRGAAASKIADAVLPQGIPYKDLTIGVPRERMDAENRVAVTPAGVATLLKKGFAGVIVEPGAGALAQFPDDAYVAAGAKIGDNALKEDIVLKLRPPSVDQASEFTPEQTLISFLYPAVNKDVVEALRKSGTTSFAMDAIPRISRAQVFDALSSMANTAGYRAILEAGNEFGRFFTGQVTAAGKIPPAKVLVGCQSEG